MSDYSSYREVNDRKNDVLPYYVYELYGNSGLFVPLHWHEEIEILYAKNTGTFILDGQSIPFKEEDVLFVNSRQLHSTYLDTGGLVYHILINPMLIYSNYSQFLNEINIHFPIKLLSKNDKYISIINELIKIKTPVDSNNELNVMSHLFSFLYILQKDGYLIKDKSTDNIQNMYIKNCVEYIRNHMSQKILIDDIAYNIGISRAYLMRLFKSYTGETINAFIINCRLEDAKNRLFKDNSISDIAYECGFSDSSHLCHLFKRKYGCSPITYRKKHS